MEQTTSVLPVQTRRNLLSDRVKENEMFGVMSWQSSITGNAVLSNKPAPTESATKYVQLKIELSGQVHLGGIERVRILLRPPRRVKIFLKGFFNQASQVRRQVSAHGGFTRRHVL
jgi:hypothetical protein